MGLCLHIRFLLVQEREELHSKGVVADLVPRDPYSATRTCSYFVGVEDSRSTGIEQSFLDDLETQSDQIFVVGEERGAPPYWQIELAPVYFVEDVEGFVAWRSTCLECWLLYEALVLGNEPRLKEDFS